MFGYILANVNSLSDGQKERYRGCYCGLCRSLKRRHGNLSRLTLNFDMTFLIMLLSSMYEPEEEAGTGRCFIHPMKEHSHWSSRFTDYAADMNVALAYYNSLDDWKDDKKLVKLAEAKALKSGFEDAKKLWPRQCAAIETCLKELERIEKEVSPDPDAAANSFGELMGELFVYYKDSWAERFRIFGQALGRFIYMMDACVDLEKDKKRGQYNPLIAMGREDLTEEEKNSILTMLIGECTAEFEKLPILQDVDIMRNVLYSGVWTQYERSRKKKGETEDDKRSL